MSRVLTSGVLAVVALTVAAGPAEAFGRRAATSCAPAPVVYCYDPCTWWCYDPCHIHCWPHHHHHHDCCWPHHHHCYCIAYKNPYTLTGGYYFVRCDGGCCSPGWHCCYVYALGRYEWVRVHRCFYGGTYDKEAEQAEGFQKAQAEMTGPAFVTATLPSDAKVFINGVAMPASTEISRRYQTPAPLGAGQTASYEFVAEFARGGKTVSVKRQVSLRPSEEVMLDFSERPEVAVADRSPRP
ncbi:MAG: TIGR03000 domain-containing protein [Gemmataceae bacterium]